MKRHVAMLSAVARGLKDLRKEVVFTGGATVDLYVLDPGAPLLRLSDDVDCVIEVASRTHYHKLEERLLTLGFKHPGMEEPAPLCRWVYEGILVDFMPTDEKILGFKNRWYSEGVQHAVNYHLPDKQEIRIFSLPYFLASKIDAFLDRGKGDFRNSADLEDVVAVLDGAETARADILAAPKNVRTYLKEYFATSTTNELFMESLEGHLASAERAARLKTLLQEMINS